MLISKIQFWGRDFIRLVAPLAWTSVSVPGPIVWGMMDRLVCIVPVAAFDKTDLPELAETFQTGCKTSTPNARAAPEQ
jgi:hypothetical protein